MKRLLPLFAVLPLLAIAITFASQPAVAGTSGGINLAWTDCGANGTGDAAFACNTNTGGVAGTVIGSYVAPAGLTQFNGIEGVLDLISATPTLPDWWNLENVAGGTPSCRTGFTVDYNFSSGPFSCTDFWAGQASGGFEYDYQFANPTNSSAPSAQRARIRVIAAVPANLQGPLNAGEEYYAFKTVIPRSKSTGTGACAGCTTPVCIVFNSLLLTQPAGVGDFLLTTPAAGGSQTVTWQGGSGATCAAVPVRSSTWGLVKSLYR